MTIKIFVLDRKTKSEGLNRDWKSIVPVSFPPIILLSYEEYEGCKPKPEHGDLVIIHLSDFLPRSGEEKLETNLDRSLCSTGCLRLLISGSGSNKSKTSQDGREYIRCAPVGYPTDPVFSSRLAIFLAYLTALPSGMNPTWGLIEPDAIPEHLVAIYLLSLAAEQNQKIDFTRYSEELEKAKVQFKALGGKNEAFLASDTNSFAEIAMRPDVRDAIRHALQSN